MTDYWLVVTIIFFAVALVVGPIFMFQPSARDRRLAGLRTSASQRGIQVRLAQLEVGAHKVKVTAYSKSMQLSRQQVVNIQPWLLIKKSITHEMHFDGDWDWQSKEQQAQQYHHTALKTLLSSLSSSVVGVGLSQNDVSLYWDERELTIEDIDQLLNQLMTLLKP